MPEHIQEAKRNTIRSGSSDYESEGGFDCSLIVLIRFMAANVVIFAAGAMPGRRRSKKIKRYYLIVVGWSVSCTSS